MRRPKVLILEKHLSRRNNLREMAEVIGLDGHVVEGKGDLLNCIHSVNPDLLLIGSGFHGSEIGPLAFQALGQHKEMPILCIRDKSDTLEGLPIPAESRVATLPTGFNARCFRSAVESLVSVTEDANRATLDAMIVGNTPVMVKLKQHILRLAKSDLTVLITGESGTGKELVARAIHELSARASKPFVKVSSPSVPEHLFESELFGFEKGAFTGAFKKKPGKFQLAHLGTFFLDEIGEIPLAMQAKLLQVLQDQEFSPLGSAASTRVNTRVLAATNAELNRMIAQSRFRLDLYYRLSVVSIHVPPLRTRTEDIDLLCEYFLRKYASTYGKTYTPLPSRVMTQFREHTWPGNVRELENAIRSIAALGAENTSFPKTTVSFRRTVPSTAPAVAPSSMGKARDELPRTANYRLKELCKEAVREAESDAIVHVLSHTEWNRKKAAALLKTSYRTLLKKMKEYRINQRGGLAQSAAGLASNGSETSRGSLLPSGSVHGFCPEAQTCPPFLEGGLI